MGKHKLRNEGCSAGRAALKARAVMRFGQGAAVVCFFEGAFWCFILMETDQVCQDRLGTGTETKTMHVGTIGPLSCLALPCLVLSCLVVFCRRAATRRKLWQMTLPWCDNTQRFFFSEAYRPLNLPRQARDQTRRTRERFTKTGSGPNQNDLPRQARDKTQTPTPVCVFVPAGGGLGRRGGRGAVGRFRAARFF